MLRRLLAVPFVTLASAASAQPVSPPDQPTRELYGELVNVDTSSKAGPTRDAEAMAKRLLDAGFAGGTSRLFEDVDDGRAHGRNERLGVKAFHGGRDFRYWLVKAVAQ